VLLAQRLQDIREEKGLSQSDISGRMALRKAYISRVENAEHMPSLRILQRWARVLHVPLYRFFYDGKTPLEQLRIFQLQTTAESASNGSHDRYLRELPRLLSRLSESNRKLLLEMAQTIRRRGPRRLSPGQRQIIPRAIAR
jgi:transcriptional regulator with XRE-family HTH domain